MIRLGIKLASFLCLASILTTNFAACNPTQNTQNTSERTDEVKKPLETIQYTIMRSGTNAKYPEDGGEGRKAMLQKMKEDGVEGVDFKLVYAGTGDYIPKIYLMIQSGEAPDMFDAGSVNDAAKFADSEVILPLDDFYKGMPNYTKVTRKEEIDALRYKGKSYILVSGYRPEPFNGPNTEGFLIRKDWLDTLSLKMPETLTDLHTVLKAFTNNDPDKNGKNDTYGFGGIKSTQFESIFGAYGIVPDYWFERNGVLKLGKVLPEAKEALKILQNWYGEGLIDKDFHTTDQKGMNEKVAASKIGIAPGGAFGVPTSNATALALFKANPQAVRMIMPAPAGAKGHRGWGENKPGYNDKMLISKTAKDPARLLKFIDWCVSEEGARLIGFGIEGVDYTYDKQKNTILQTKYEDSDTMIKKGFGNPVRFIQLVDRRHTDEPTKEALATAGKYLIKNQFWGSVPALSEYPELNDSWNEYFVKIVTGQLPVDAWDEYVQQYYQKGGKEIEDQVNAEWKKIKK